MAEPIKQSPLNVVPARSAWGRIVAGLLVCWSLIAMVGCRHIDNAQVDVMESELRKQEDYIYELEEYLVEYSEKLRQARAMQCETIVTSKSAPSGSSIKEPTLDVDSSSRPSLPMNGRSKMSAQKSTLPAPPATTEAPPAETAPAVETPVEATPGPEEVSPDEMEAPSLEIGPGVQAKPLRNADNVAAVSLPVDAAPPLLIPDPIDYQAEGDELVAEAPPTIEEDDADNNQVADGVESLADAPLLAAPQVSGERLSADHLQIRRVFAERAAPGGEAISSLLIVVEVLNDTEEPVGAEGEASLMIMARDESGGMQRIERWDFNAAETAAAWQSSHLGDGLHLELPMAKSEMPAGELELWARVVSGDGRKLLTQIPLEPAQLIAMADFNEQQAETTAGTNAVELPPQPLVETPATSEPAEPVQVAAAPVTKAVAETVVDSQPKPTWKASSVQLNEQRVASTAVEAKGKPTWKRSTAPVDEAESKQDWAPFR